MPRLPWLALPLAYFLYFFGITAAGMIGPDEPRYASIGREMARTGDWITPRLWGAPWFEKPALLYWMTGAAFRTGLGADLAPRFPVALLSVAFLVFFWWILWREFGCFIAWMATLILATSAGWCLYSESGVTDIPLSATFSAAMMLAIPWISKRDTRLLPFAGALFGLAVLAKGPVALILAAPLAVRWRDLVDWFRPKVILPFLLIAAPWYIACYLRNGTLFFNDFFWKHNVGRFTSPELQHGQRWWFYLPALAVLFLPWSALLPIAFRPAARRRATSLPPRLGALAAGLLFTFRKQTARIYPAGFSRDCRADCYRLGRGPLRRGVAGCLALLTAAFAIAAPLVDIGGLARGAHPVFHPIWLLPIPVAIAAWLLDMRRKRLACGSVRRVRGGRQGSFI